MPFDEEEDAALVGHISRALAGQGVAPVKSLTDPALIDFRSRGRKTRLPPAAKKSSSGGGGAGASLRRSRTAVAAKHGQAVVKVLSFGHGRQSVRNQADYISRKGEIPLEDQEGNLIEGADEVKELIEGWSDDFSEFLNARDSLHMQISVPEGSDREAAHDAVRAFAKETFSENYEYVFVRHDDTNHPHSHILVKTKGRDGKKLNPRKKDLARWREVYAREASERGILLDASSRRSRGQGKKGKAMAVVKAAERGESARAVVATAEEVIRNPQQPHEGDIAAQARFKEERAEFAKLGLSLKELAKQDGERGERAKAILARVHDHTVNMKEPASMRKDMQGIVAANENISQAELIEGYQSGALIPSKAVDGEGQRAKSAERDGRGPSPTIGR